MPTMDSYINKRRQSRNSSILQEPASLAFFDRPTMLVILEGDEGTIEDSAGLKEIQMESWQVLKTDRIRVSGPNIVLQTYYFCKVYYKIILAFRCTSGFPVSV
jgi:hypothetical protein